MLTSFFSKSKPINFLAVILFMAAFYLLANLRPLLDSFSLSGTTAKFGVLIVFIISVSVLNFIAKKNDLTKRSAFKILIFGVLSVSFWEILRNDQVIIANLCVLLALRRVISLRSQKDIRQKIFDATFWICIASLFYFWAILFLLIVYSGILLHVANYFKNWLVPGIAFLAVFGLVTSFSIIMYDDFYTFSLWFETSSFDFEQYSNPALFIPLSIILALCVWTLFFYLGLLQKANINSRPTYILVLLTLVTAIAVALFSPVKNGSELLFFFVPLSIISSNYFESKKEKVFKEILLFGLILMPILIPFIF
ncbi:hypothetical protein FHG64_09410 [Antarcticibacterium flavum]|uniref:Beta-carotene 15,15'-monooxygenase n=1 Tax=Antarcticibacterium flavum TaxID=2058175 RepID=A0A5B7X272_9FLAO|nr:MULTISPECIES: DUF6427 family protein [Antarcticibacterium]MCM4159198.1 hypothetical protein [Antarcticibacterium sp. W02-3]QCY69596.1 hypothetical protein FHG64_09410 [Antarcticibacterium flavum]